MATNVTMPKLGLTMETGKIVEWKAAEGGEVKKGEILLVVETEKITYEVEAPESGLLHIVVEQDAEVPVAELIGVIAADKAEYDKACSGAGTSAAAATKNNLTPSLVPEKKQVMEEIQDKLLADDCFLPGIEIRKNDLAVNAI